IPMEVPQRPLPETWLAIASMPANRRAAVRERAKFPWCRRPAPQLPVTLSTPHSLLRQKEPVSLENDAAFAACHERLQCLHGLLALRPVQNDPALLQPGIGIERDHPVSTSCLHGGGQRQRQGDEPSVCRPPFHVLSCLSDVLAQDQAILHV